MSQVTRTHAFIAVLAVAALFAIGATASFAQSPTEDAYSLNAGLTEAGNGGGGGGEANQPVAQGGEQGAPAAQPKGGELPFTGFDAGIAVLLGAGLLGTGLMLRRSARATA